MRNTYSYAAMFLLALMFAACNGKTADVDVDVTGTWNGEITGSNGTAPFAMTLTQKGITVSGSISAGGSQSPISGTVANDIIKLSVQEANGSLQFSGTVDSDSMTGTVTVTRGGQQVEGDFTATR